MKRRVDVKKIQWMLAGFRLTLESTLEETFQDLPHNPNGPQFDQGDFVKAGVALYDNHVFPAIVDFANGVIPEDQDDLEPEPEPEPSDEMYGYAKKEKATYKGVIHISGNYPHRYVWPKDGPDYGDSFLIRGSDGQELFVFDSKKGQGDGYIIGADNRKYVAGKPYFSGADEHQTMEYYAAKGTKPNEVWVYYGKPELKYETYFHHTTTASSDGGKSLVLCPGDRREFDRVYCGNVTIPRHADDNNRVTYWNMYEEPKGDIIAEKDGKKYRYPCNETITYGNCKKPEPQQNSITVSRTNRISINSVWRDRFVFKGLGPDYGKRLRFVFSNGDELVVPDSSRRWQPGGDLASKYQPGYTYSYNPPNPDIPTMEVYLRAGANANSVTMFYEEHNPIDPPGDNSGDIDHEGWNHTAWGGDPNETSEGRSRLWWSKPHGGSYPHWHRKIPLPKWLDDDTYRIQIRTSTGNNYDIPSSKMDPWMGPGDAKYKPQITNEPNKDHPKFVAALGDKIEWIKWKATKV